MNERFDLRKNHLFQKGLSMGFSVLLLIMLIILMFIVGGSGGVLQLKSWAPLLLIGLAIWSTYDVIQFRKAIKYKVVLHDDAIEAGGEKIA